MATDFFCLLLKNTAWRICGSNKTYHTTRANMAFLQEKFPGRVISRRGGINWPPRSCDLTPLDFMGLREESCLYR